MRTMTLLLVCLSLALAGCARFGAGAGSPSASASGDKPDDPVVSVPDPVPPIIGDGSVRQEPDPSVFDEHGVAVDHFTIGADGRTVVVYWWGGNTTCFALKAVEVDVPHGTPIVTVLEGTRESARGRVCTMEAALKSAVVTLRQALLMDAANPTAEPGEAQLPDRALAVKPLRGVDDPRPHAVSGYSLSADGMTLSAYYVGGTEACYALASATAERDGGGPLTVSLREGRRPGGDAACDDIGVAKVVKIVLEQPLMVTAAFNS